MYLSDYTSTETSIKLKTLLLPAERSTFYRDHYIIEYEVSTRSYPNSHVLQPPFFKGRDICDSNTTLVSKTRLKSRGFVVFKPNVGGEVLIDKLIPYTGYDIKVWSVVRGEYNSYYFNTLPGKLKHFVKQENTVIELMNLVSFSLAPDYENKNSDYAL